MFDKGQHVMHKWDGARATVIEDQEDQVLLTWDHNPDARFTCDPDMLVAVEDVPGPSEPADPIHAYYLQHARNAGAAVQALRIIQSEAETALGSLRQTDGDDERAALTFIEGFAADVLSHVTGE